MMRHAYLTLLVVMGCLGLLGCSTAPASNSANVTNVSASNVSNTSNASNITYASNTTVTNASNVHQSPTNEQRAIEAVRNYVEARFTKCGDSYVAENGAIYQYKNPSFVLTRTKPVTQADTLNGIEWSGEVNFTYSAMRQFNGGQWYPWENYQQFVDLTFDVWKAGSVFRVKSHQEIRFNNYDKVPCSKVPN